MKRQLRVLLLLIAAPLFITTGHAAELKCDTAKKHIVMTNSTQRVLSKGTMVRWSTSHGEAGKLRFRSNLATGKALKVSIKKSSPKTCTVFIRAKKAPAK